MFKHGSLLSENYRLPRVTSQQQSTILHRVHAAPSGARFYGRKDATWRWDDPAEDFGVLYLGHDQTGPFAETLLRRPRQRAVLWSEIDKRRFARFHTLEPLLLADLHGSGLAWFGITITDIAAEHDGITYPGAYEITQSIAARVHAETQLDGIQYRSRLDTDALCIALFERADPKIALTQESEEIDRIWVQQLFEPRGYRLIDL